MAWIDLETNVNAEVMSIFAENIILHLFEGDTATNGIYTEAVTEDMGILRTDYYVDLLPDDAALLKKGDQLTIRSMLFEMVKSTPNNGLEHLELRRL